jgi:hypothetical protein
MFSCKYGYRLVLCTGEVNTQLFFVFHSLHNITLEVIMNQEKYLQNKKHFFVC